MEKNSLPAWHGPIFSDSITPRVETNTGNGARHKHHKDHQEGQQQIQEGMERRAVNRRKNAVKKKQCIIKCSATLKTRNIIEMGLMVIMGTLLEAIMVYW